MSATDGPFFMGVSMTFTEQERELLLKGLDMQVSNIRALMENDALNRRRAAQFFQDDLDQLLKLRTKIS